MKILLLSDIHGNREALEAILRNEKSWDLLVCAGDFVDYGTSPSFVVDYFASQSSSAKLVQGNHDAHTVREYRKGAYESLPSDEFKWVHYTCQHLKEQHIAFLEALPMHLSFEADGYVYLLQHQYDEKYGVIESPEQFDSYWQQCTDAPFDPSLQRRMIFGHSHRQCTHMLFGNREWINPGSISYRRPDDSNKDAQYMVIEGGKIRFCQLPYDRAPQFRVAEAFARKNGMMKTELQDFYFFFGDARSSRDELPLFQEIPHENL